MVETDGVLVRYRHPGWHEVKLGLVAGCVAGLLRAPSYVAALACFLLACLAKPSAVCLPLVAALLARFRGAPRVVLR